MINTLVRSSFPRLIDLKCANWQIEIALNVFLHSNFTPKQINKCFMPIFNQLIDFWHFINCQPFYERIIHRQKCKMLINCCAVCVNKSAIFSLYHIWLVSIYCFPPHDCHAGWLVDWARWLITGHTHSKCREISENIVGHFGKKTSIYRGQI